MSVKLPHRVDADDGWDRAYKEATVQGAQEKALWLLEHLGARVTTAALGMKDARQVKKWASGDAEPREHDVQGRLNVLFRIAFAITTVYDSGAVAAAFLRSSNPQLDDEAPLFVLAMGNPDTEQRRLLAATRAFLEGW